MFLELNSEGLYQSSGNEKGSCCLEFPSSTKREIKLFRVLVVERRLRNVQKSVMHVQSCCFANINLLPFCSYRCCGCCQAHYSCDPEVLSTIVNTRHTSPLNTLTITKFALAHLCNVSCLFPVPFFTVPLNACIFSLGRPHFFGAVVSNTCMTR